MNFGNNKPPLQAKRFAEVADAFENKTEIEFTEGTATRVGYLANVRQIVHKSPLNEEADYAAILMYFIEPSGKWFKAEYVFNPYFYILCTSEQYVSEVIFQLQKQYE